MEGVAQGPGVVGEFVGEPFREGASPSVTTTAAQPPSPTSSQGCIGNGAACSTRGSDSMARARSNHAFIGPCAVRNFSWCVTSGILRTP